jgi:hypothetical protein
MTPVTFRELFGRSVDFATAQNLPFVQAIFCDKFGLELRSGSMPEWTCFDKVESFS